MEYFLRLSCLCLMGFTILIHAPTQDTIRLNGMVDEVMYIKFIKDISKSKSKRHSIIIDSRGGYVMEGFKIISEMETLRKLGHTFSCTVTELAASMAATIFQTCDNRYAIKGAIFMQHKSTVLDPVMAQNPIVKLRGVMIDIQRFSYTFKRLKIPQLKFIKDYVLPEKFFGVNEALSIGYIDRIY